LPQVASEASTSSISMSRHEAPPLPAAGFFLEVRYERRSPKRAEPLLRLVLASEQNALTFVAKDWQPDLSRSIVNHRRSVRRIYRRLRDALALPRASWQARSVRMRRIPRAIYQTADEIDARIRERESNALSLEPDSEEHRTIMKEIAQLRIYSEAKRWIASPGLLPGR
jgi:hypothetical protein